MGIIHVQSMEGGEINGRAKSCLRIRSPSESLRLLARLFL